MKKIKLLFLISFIFYFIGQTLWTVNIFSSKIIIEDWILNLPFGIFSLLIIYTAIKWYKYN